MGLEGEDVVQDGQGAVTRGLERLSRLMPNPHGVRVEWYAQFTTQVQDAYVAVGGEEWVPSELTAQVLRAPSEHRKVVAVLYRGDSPWAVVPLRLMGQYWEPLWQGVIPEIPLFACVGRRSEVLAALGLNVGCWSSIESPVGRAGVRWQECLPCYQLDLSQPPDAYWRTSGLWKTLNRVKRQTAGLELIVDDIAGAVWTIENWRDRHSTGKPQEVTAKWGDRITVAQWGLPRGQVHCWNLRDGANWVAGLTGSIRGGRMSSSSIFRDRRYDELGAGNRTWYELFKWSYENRLDVVSMGAQFGYKSYWAPPVGVQWSFIVAPRPVHMITGAMERARRLVTRLRDS